MELLKKLWLFLFGYKGRISRLHYGIFLLAWLPISFIATTIAMVISRILADYFGIYGGDRTLIIQLILTSAITWPILLSYMIRRIHDCGKRARDSMIFSLYILAVIGTVFIKSLDTLYLVSFIMFILMISLVFFKGDLEENQFGMPPRRKNIKKDEKSLAGKN